MEEVFKPEVGKLYLVLDEHNVIQKGFIQNTAEPEIGKWFKKGCNFDEATDFESATIVDGISFDDVIFGKSQIVDNKFIKNEDAE